MTLKTIKLSYMKYIGIFFELNFIAIKIENVLVYQIY